MKRALLSTASAAALFAYASPALAGPDFSGVVQVHAGAGTTESFFGGKTLDDPVQYGGRAQGYWPLSPDIHFQADVFLDQINDVAKGIGPSDGDATRFGGAIHLLHPLENRARFGVAGSVWNTDIFFADSPDLFDDEATFGLVALEAQVFGEEWTLSGQAGVFDSFSCDNFCLLDHGTYIRGNIRYFLNDNTQLSVEGLQMWGTAGDDVFGGKSLNSRTSIWSLEAEHKFRESSFSAFVTLSHESNESDFIFQLESQTQTAMFGFKFYYDQPTLKANDRSGPSLNTPQFGGAFERASAMGSGFSF